jgi:osmotically-inducible protein OsmY
MKTDSQLQKDILDELKWDPSVTHEHIGVSVTNSIVTLSGNVPSFIEKWNAEKAAQKVAGVKAVVEKIDVRLPGLSVRDDETIAKTLVDQFKWNIQVPDQLVKVQVEDGWVELSGEVEWEYQRAAAESTARGLTGVVGVSNNISLKQKKIRSEDIKKKIEEALKREAEKEASEIRVEVKDGKVTLTGDVRSSSEMQDVKWAAWSAPGVVDIENKMRINR